MPGLEEPLRFLSLLRRGGYVEIGEGVRSSLKKTSCLILASDASDSVKADIEEIADYRGLPLLTGVSKEELGSALGFNLISVAALTNRKAAKTLIGKWQDAVRKGEPK